MSERDEDDAGRGGEPLPPQTLGYARPQGGRRWTASWVVLVVVLSLLGAAALLFGACVLALR